MRAYRRAAELVRETRAPVAELVRAGRVRELRGIGPGIERAPHGARRRPAGSPSSRSSSARSSRSSSRSAGSSASGRSGWSRSAARSASAPRTSSARRPRPGRLREAPGIGPADRAEDPRGARARAAAARGAALLLNRARALAEAIARALGGEVAGEVRRWRDVVHELAVVVHAAPARARAVRALAADRRASSSASRDARSASRSRASRSSSSSRSPDASARSSLRATGSPAYVASLGALPDAPDEEERLRAPRPAVVPAGAARGAARRASRRALVELARHPRRPALPHDVVGRQGDRRRRWRVAARDLGYEYLAICDHTPNVRVVPGLDADALRRQAEEIAAANERLAPFRVLRGTECDIRRDGTLDLPDDVLAELDWVQLSLHAGQREDADRLTRKVTEAMRHPAVRCLEPPEGPDHQPPPAERARPRAR